jgi:hypothetical protein
MHRRIPRAISKTEAVLHRSEKCRREHVSAAENCLGGGVDHHDGVRIIVHYAFPHTIGNHPPLTYCFSIARTDTNIRVSRSKLCSKLLRAQVLCCTTSTNSMPP